MIVDDERLSRNRIRSLLAEETGFQVLGECVDGPEAIESIAALKPDLLFLDVQMPGMDGFDVLRALPKEQVPLTIFVTAFDEYALRAFEVHAFDYLLKPFDRSRFREAMERVRSHWTGHRVGAIHDRLAALLRSLERGQPETDRIAIRKTGRVIFLRTDQIDWVEAADNYVCLHCGAETHTLRETMNSLEQRLDGNKFLRIHRSTIINIDRIKELQPWFRGDYRVLLHDGKQLTLSRNYRERLHSKLWKTL